MKKDMIEQLIEEVHYAKDDTLQMGAYEVTFSSGNLVRACKLR